MQQAVAGDAGIVDDDIDRAQLGFDLGEAFLALGEARDVPLVDRDAGLFLELGRRFVIAGVIRRNDVAGVLQRNRNGVADTTRAASDDRNPSHVFLQCPSLIR